MLRLLKYLKPREWIYALVSVGFIVMQVWLEIKMPEYTAAITEILNFGAGSMTDIWINGGWMLFCAFGSVACSIVTSWFIAQIAANFSARLRDELYGKVQTFSMEEINKFSTASLITRSTNDVQQVQFLVAMGLQMLIKAPIMAIWAITVIAGKEWQWSVATAASVAVMLAGILVIMLLVYKKFRKMQKLTDHLNQTTRENLSGLRVIRAYNAEGYQEEKFAKVNEEFTRTNRFTGRTMAFLSPTMSLVMNGLNIAIYWIGAVLINNAPITEVATLFSDMIVFMSYGMLVVAAFMMLTIVFMFLPRSLVAAGRIREVLNTECRIKDGNGVGETAEKGTVEFKNVSFRYPDGAEDVLTEVSFRAERGQTIAFIGATGCGKSTIVNLVSRFYDATAGEVFVDGHDVRDYTKEELNKKISYVSQKAVLFSGSIRENIDFGDNDADEEAVKRAVSIAQSTDFVEKQENAYDGHVSQNGSNFSGGQKQRLSIARAVARNAEIYIFDDTFSALDYTTDRNLRKALKEEVKDATCLIVAQRIGTIKDADLILVLESGKVVGAGKHDELIQSCPTYLEIAKSQLSEEEL
ncbi:MAG: ABC transporter ATP-binding protein/permease [Clostridia bacterium]|nr:ABC transporter ATP-binding protein/permease [Clostridia bacterium]